MNIKIKFTSFIDKFTFEDVGNGEYRITGYYNDKKIDQTLAIPKNSILFFDTINYNFYTLTLNYDILPDNSENIIVSLNY